MISIIIPTLNEESVIGETLADLKSRLTIPHEIIVTDGKSTDRTVEIARTYATAVVTYAGSARQTIAEGRNDGARAAHGEFLAFMDADCRFADPDAFFTEALTHFDADPRAAGLTVAIRVLPRMETAADKIVFIIFNNYLRLVNNVFGLGISAGEFQMIRRSAFDKVGGYRPELVASEDIDIFYRLSKMGRIVFDSSITVFHTGRRAHKIGWPKLIATWIMNSFYMWTTGRAYSKEWKVIR
ncbi:MAG: hypothetical protein QOG91_644 [Candidatus Parcubacteria bacterium]|jgi:glycosyltransferase involved in cell wall biosynthesis|nr:hypothetical protein [Candidatus Parcubacteria bacterium]